MEIETIKESGKKAIVKLLNKALQVEYTKIVNYPPAGEGERALETLGPGFAHQEVSRARRLVGRQR